jgi:ATP-dependent helicase/nuclease subunit A
VEVLTVHGAKGLEFHTVFLPFLDWQPLKMEGNAPAPFLLEEIPGTRAHVLGLAPPAWQTGDSAYRLVAHLKQERVLAEARRVFYVAVTRAQARLFLSGVLPVKKGAMAPPPPDSPLSWLWQHYRPGGVTPGDEMLWAGPDLRVEVLPEASPVCRTATPPPRPPEPWDFTPELPPYSLTFPSQEAVQAWAGDVSGDAGDPAGDLASRVARARGEVTHRLLQPRPRGGAVADAAGVAAALAGFGVDRDKARRLAPEILAEVAACLADPALAALLQPGAAVSEWALEDQPAPGVIRRGRLDLLAHDGKNWWLVDFKTSRPPDGVAWDDFLSHEKEKYRPQLTAYREMTAGVKDLAAPEDIRLALYFTACRKMVEL